MSNRGTLAAWLVPGLMVLSGCGVDFLNLTAPFGGNVAGGRGQVQIAFINNTPYRAVFTFATYDQTDPASELDFLQFSHDETGLILEGNSTSAIVALECARVFSIGSPRMLDLIAENLPVTSLADEAIIEGVEFFIIPDGDSAVVSISQGKSSPFEALLGVDFPCNALLIVRFEIDDLGPDPFRIDFELIPSQSTR